MKKSKKSSANRTAALTNRHSSLSGFKLALTGAGIAGLLATGALAQPETSSQTSQGSQGYEQPSQSGQSGRQYQGSQQQSAQSTQQGSQQQRQAQSESRGVIQWVDRDSQTFGLRGPRMHRDFAWSETTQILRNGKSVGPEQLKKGDRVSITYQKQGERQVAQQIEIRERQHARAGKHSEKY